MAAASPASPNEGKREEKRPGGDMAGNMFPARMRALLREEARAKQTKEQCKSNMDKIRPALMYWLKTIEQKQTDDSARDLFANLQNTGASSAIDWPTFSFNGTFEKGALLEIANEASILQYELEPDLNNITETATVLTIKVPSTNDAKYVAQRPTHKRISLSAFQKAFYKSGWVQWGIPLITLMNVCIGVGIPMYISVQHTSAALLLALVAAAALLKSLLTSSPMMLWMEARALDSNYSDKKHVPLWCILYCVMQPDPIASLQEIYERVQPKRKID